MPGISGMENNALLLEFGRHDGPEVLEEVADGMLMAGVPHMDRLVLRHGEKFFGTRKSIHVWLTWHDARNANLMILLSYILLGHRDWQDAEVSLFAAYPRSEVKERREEIHQMIREGRLLISEKNVLVIPTDDSIDFERLVEARSSGAGSLITGCASDAVTYSCASPSSKMFSSSLRRRRSSSTESRSRCDDRDQAYQVTCNEGSISGHTLRMASSTPAASASEGSSHPLWYPNTSSRGRLP